MHILTFTLRNELFAVDAMAVKEIVLLPELTPVEEMPGYIVGVFNLRGNIVPVMDLNIRFGHEQERFRLTDRVIIIECGVRSAECGTEGTVPDLRAKQSEAVESGLSPAIYGIIVNDVHDVISISESDIESITPQSALRIPHLLAGEVRVGEEIIMLLDHHSIAEFGMRNAELKEKHSALHTPLSAFAPEEQAVFHERARALMQPPEEVVVEGRIPLAVISLNGEYFGVDLEVVKEFADLRGVTPVPCTPAHIVGDMNLRGDILTIVDICGMLNLRSAEFGVRNSESTKEKHSALRTPHSAFNKKAVISQVNDLVAGVTVDDVIEVINTSPSDVRPVPASVEAVGNEYIRGELPYQGKMLTILDMKKIVTSKEMVVGEEA